MSNLDLFSPASRRTDPLTSHSAEEKHTILGKRAERMRQVLQLIVDSPGSTTGELSRYMHTKHPDLPMRTVAESPHKRVTDLMDRGLVSRGTKLRCLDSGYECYTWYPTQSGIDEAY